MIRPHPWHPLQRQPPQAATGHREGPRGHGPFHKRPVRTVRIRRAPAPRHLPPAARRRRTAAPVTPTHDEEHRHLESADPDTAPEPEPEPERPVMIKREQPDGLVTVRSPKRFTGSDTSLNELLQRNGGFYPERRRGGIVLVLPAHIPGDEQQLRASRAAATLELLGRRVSLARELRVPGAQPDLSSIYPQVDVLQIGEGIAAAASSDEAAALLLEISSPLNGVLAEAASVLQTASWWWSGAQPLIEHMPHTDRLDALARQLHAVASEVSEIRTVLGRLNRERDVPPAAARRTAATTRTTAVPRGTGPVAASFDRASAGVARAHRP